MNSWFIFLHHSSLSNRWLQIVLLAAKTPSAVTPLLLPVLCNNTLPQSVVISKRTQKSWWKSGSPGVFLSLCRTPSWTERGRSKGNFHKSRVLLACICVIILLNESNICIIWASAEWEGTLFSNPVWEHYEVKRIAFYQIRVLTR